MDQNPWQSEASQGTPQRNDPRHHETSHTYTQPTQSRTQTQSQGWSNPNISDSTQNPWGGVESQGPPSFPAQQSYQQPQPQSQYQQQHQYQQYQAPPNPPPRRTDNETAALLASQPDRGEQIEHMQSYEANKRLTQDERDQADLQRQFPGIDGSLIAAIYSDHRDQRGGHVDLASIRETLQELQS